MILETWDREKPTVEIIRLRLIEQDGYIELSAVDKYGKRIKRGSLLKIHSEGTIMRMENIDEELGFKLNADGEVQLTNEVEE